MHQLMRYVSVSAGFVRPQKGLFTETYMTASPPPLATLWLCVLAHVLLGSAY